MGVADAPRRVTAETGTDAGGRPGRSERAYAALLRLYPAQFRARYGDEMAVLFSDQVRDAQTAGVGGGVAMFWIRAALDIGSSALGEHLRRDQVMAQSLATFEPTRGMRLLGLVGLSGGVLLLWAFISFDPFQLQAANTVRLIVFALGGAAIAIAFHGRQARVAPRLAAVATAAVVISGVLDAALIVLALWVERPFSGAFGALNFWASGALWLSAAAYGVAMLRIGVAWQGMSRPLAVATRIGALALLGGVLAWVGDDRLGLVDSVAYGQLWSTVALASVFLVGLGWVVLGAVLAIGARGMPRAA